jgi:acyl-CoA thioesterase-1
MRLAVVGTIRVRRQVGAIGLAFAVACGGSAPTSPTGIPSTPPVVTNPSPTPTPTPPLPIPEAPPAAVPSLSVTRILCFGDSMTAGFIAISSSWLRNAPGDSYPAQLQLLLSDRYRNQSIVVENAGIMGEWAEDGKLRIVSVVRAFRPDVVVLLEGANDLSGLGSAGIDSALDGLENMLRDARGLGARVILASLPPHRSSGSPGGFSPIVPEFNLAVQRLALRQGVLFADVYQAFASDTSLIGPDGIHPTARGYGRIAQTIFDVLRANFERPAPAVTNPNPTRTLSVERALCHVPSASCP